MDREIIRMVVTGRLGRKTVEMNRKFIKVVMMGTDEWERGLMDRYIVAMSMIGRVSRAIM